MDGAESGLRQPQEAGESPLLPLLRAYRDLLEHRTPPLAWIRRGRGLGTLARTPSIGWVVGYFVAAHVSRAAAALERRYAMQLAVGEGGPRKREELTRIKEFRQAAPRVLAGRVALTSAFTAVSSFGLAGLKRLDDAVDVKGSFIELRYFVAGSDSLGEEAASWLVLIALALAVVAMPVVASFRLKRALFDGYPQLGDAVERPASDYGGRSAGVYELEREAFARVRSRPPKEFPLDLAVVALPITMVATSYAMIGLIAVQDRDVAGGLIGSAWFALSLVLTGAVVAHKRRLARARTSAPRGAAPASPPASIRNRARAQLGDLAPLFGLCIPLWIGVGVTPGLEGDPAAVTAAFGVPPLAAALYVALSLAGAGRRHGGSFGKSRRGIAVVRRDGTPAEPWRLVLREVVLKWGLLGPGALAALFLPLALNVLWPFIDRENRALHDVLAGTVVTHAHAEPALEPSITTA